jgi:hypothetical protein
MYPAGGLFPTLIPGVVAMANLSGNSALKYSAHSFAKNRKTIRLPLRSPGKATNASPVRCIEAGVDVPTVARWLGHVDGGALAMRVYGHLRREHSAAMAQRVTFGHV